MVEYLLQRLLHFSHILSTIGWVKSGISKPVGHKKARSPRSVTRIRTWAGFTRMIGCLYIRSPGDFQFSSFIVLYMCFNESCGACNEPLGVVYVQSRWPCSTLQSDHPTKYQIYMLRYCLQKIVSIIFSAYASFFFSLMVTKNHIVNPAHGSIHPQNLQIGWSGCEGVASSSRVQDKVVALVYVFFFFL